MKKMISSCNESKRTKPENAYNMDVQVQKGDIVIIGTDGFYDNMWNSEVLEALDHFSKNKKY